MTQWLAFLDADEPKRKHQMNERNANLPVARTILEWGSHATGATPDRSALASLGSARQDNGG
jgi:hypothetical protein